jgi:23S rRNA pseudouridine1911/1915/1917 synthase
MLRRFRTVVPPAGPRGPQPVWRVGSVLKYCLGLSRPERARIWRSGGAAVNGIAVPAQHVHCRPGDVVEAWYPEDASSVAPEAELPLDVLYEDEWLLAVNKPAGQLSHPARRERHGTVANAVAARYRSPEAVASPSRETPLPVEPSAPVVEPVRLIHRLDRDTSGLLLFARDARTARSLARQRAAGVLVREYLALVAGHPPPEGEIDLWLGPDPAHRTRRTVHPRPAEARAGPDERLEPARTRYRVVQYGAQATLVAARLLTGRTHQLRAHFAGIGHPLVGDALYGGPVSPHIARQALHAWRARLRHPMTGAPLTLVAPPPSDFAAAARRVLGRAKGAERIIRGSSCTSAEDDLRSRID